MNYEVVRKVIPCAFYMGEDASMDDCRWCNRLYHIREEGFSRTLCSHNCLEEDGWAVVGGDYEDVSAIDRCYTCYRRVDRHS